MSQHRHPQRRPAAPIPASGCSTCSPGRPASTAIWSRSARCWVTRRVPGRGRRRRARHRGQRHPRRCAPNRAWEGFRAGQFVQVSVEIDGVRRTRCYSPASRRGLRPRARAHRQAPPRGTGLELPRRHARPGMVARPLAGRRRLPPSRSRPDSILLISGGSGITPVMSMLRTLCAEGHAGPIAFLHYAPDPERAIYREELERLAAAQPELPLVRSYTRAPGAGELDGHFSPAHLRRPRARLRRRPRPSPAARPPCSTPCAGPGRPTGLEQRLHVESFVPPSLLAVGEPGEGTIRFAGSDVRGPRTAARPCSSRPRRPASAPQSAAGWASATPAPAARRAGTVRNLLTGEVSSGADEEIQICVSAPLGDVVVDL